MQQHDYLIINHGGFWQRFLEILPGLSSWLFLLSPIILSLFAPVWVAYLIIGYDLIWLTKSFGLGHRLIRGYKKLRQLESLDWLKRLEDLKDINKAIARVERRLASKRISRGTRKQLKTYKKLLRSIDQAKVINPDDLCQAVIVTAFNESLAILEPTIKALSQTHYPLKKMIVLIAYEERGGVETKRNARYLVKKYKHFFKYMDAIEHPRDIPGEVKGKGGNITYTGRWLLDYVVKAKIRPANVIVTTLDSDNRPGPEYFGYLSFIYASTPDRKHCSYQPMPMYFNNIWDVPAPMRVIATGNSFWVLVEAMRPHRLRNFSAHSQSLDALIETDFWSTQTVVEDGHQFWRSYFAFNGNYRVIPLHIPVYQDAVLAQTYWQTMKAQFIQLRRWAYGASDIPYVIINSYKNKHISWHDKLAKLLRLIEGHFSWATAPLILALAAWAPLLLNPDFNRQSALAHLLPVIASRIQTLAMVGLAITILISLISLPSRPSHYSRRRSLGMLLQWALLPFTTVLFSAFAALNAQTRLMLGRYLEQFDVTEKATRS